MSTKKVLIFASVISVILITLWTFNIITESLAALGGAIFTLIGYLYTTKDEVKKLKGHRPMKIKQIHKGKGDNIIGDKNSLK